MRERRSWRSLPRILVHVSLVLTSVACSVDVPAENAGGGISGELNGSDCTGGIVRYCENGRLMRVDCGSQGNCGGFAACRDGAGAAEVVGDLDCEDGTGWWCVGERRIRFEAGAQACVPDDAGRGPAEEDPAPADPVDCTYDCPLWCADLSAVWCDGDEASPCACPEAGEPDGGGDGEPPPASDECQPACDLWAMTAITCEDGAQVVDPCPYGWTCAFVDERGVPVDDANVPSTPVCLTCDDAGELTCDDGAGCYMPEWICDGTSECQDGTDEYGC